MTTTNFTNIQSSLTQGKVKWSSPSNIAFVKYWGKRSDGTETQLPMNPSLSMTLKHSYTEMEMSWGKRDDRSGPTLDFYFEGSRFPQFSARIENYLNYLADRDYDFLKEYSFKVQASNTFPHSAGIASSASSMSALALCLQTLISIREGKELEGERFFQSASYLARLASGSASRSLWPKMAMWGRSAPIDGTNDLTAIPLQGVHPSFENLQDTILVVSDSVKNVSSGAGHKLMERHPYAHARFKRADENFLNTIKALRDGDWAKWGELLEGEALDLHAMMMTSTPSYMLMRPESVAIIDSLRELRLKTGYSIYFTLDAGPNVHVLYPEQEKEQVSKLIKEECSELCKKIIWDEMGTGPKLMELE